jgi:hypothetical protein
MHESNVLYFHKARERVKLTHTFTTATSSQITTFTDVQVQLSQTVKLLTCVWKVIGVTPSITACFDL